LSLRRGVARMIDALSGFPANAMMADDRDD